MHAGTQTRSGVGSYIVCPKGEAQVAAIQASDWYRQVQDQMRNRGFENLRLGPASQKGKNKNPAS